MKFVHIADIHFDTPFENLKNKKSYKDRIREEQIEAFKKVITYIRENEIDLFIISGDLFEQEHVEIDTIEFIIKELKTIPEVKILISPGNHDPLIANSPYNKFEWPDNVYIFNGEVGRYDFDDISIYGVGFNKYEMEKGDIASIKVDTNRVNLLVTHGTLNGNSKKYHDIKESDLSKFDYCALRTYTFAKNR